LAEHWDLPNTGIFYSKDAPSEVRERSVFFHAKAYVIFLKINFGSQSFFLQYDGFVSKKLHRYCVFSSQK
jgi:hypothetical protein